MTTLQPLVAQIARLLLTHRETIATAESCTGGRLASFLTAQAGASAWYASGAITYSEEQKAQLLGVDPSLIARHGVVSREVALAMARGAQECFGSDHALATTGFAGPLGGSTEAPIGTVWVGLALGGQLYAHKLRIQKGREALIAEVCREALRLFIHHYTTKK